ncbi:glycosyltransferase family 25 protein [Actibacterium pelagium]|uniref:Glycosyl transferase family 25 domain-containing protein n=1 Tax=Actibacterium pelagium TaxID=2029103 RepID=A0A917AKY5_9RHOB|nr:glycosyltransferase family 25 protein [Actibacterium pelagium]GGE59868.1 hypothetical protein GCM10011517_29320 [Actibacterium pelagium]
MKRLSTFLINLNSSRARLESSRSKLTTAGIGFERVSAFDGRGMDPLSCPEYDEARALSWFGRKLSGAELGCYFSHVRAAERFLESGSEYGLVLEDDIKVQPDARADLEQVIDILDSGHCENWYMVNLGRKVKRLYQPCQPLHQAGGNLFCKAHYFPDTTSAILWSRTGAKEFLKVAYPIFMPVDHFLRYWNCETDEGFGVTSPIFPQLGQDSVIRAAAPPSELQRARFYHLRKQRRLWANKIKAKKNLQMSAIPNGGVADRTTAL